MTLVQFCKFAILSRLARWPGTTSGRDADIEKETDMAQMTIVEREGIEDGLRRGWTIPEIAAYVKRPPQTITNEIKNRRVGFGAADATNARVAATPATTIIIFFIFYFSFLFLSANASSTTMGEWSDVMRSGTSHAPMMLKSPAWALSTAM